MFAGVHTQQDLFALTAPQALSRWIEAQDPRTQMRRSFEVQNCLAAAAELLARFPVPKRAVATVAIRDDTTAFVIHVIEGFGSYGSPEFLVGGEMLMSLHRKGSAWLIDPRSDLMHPGPQAGISYGCPHR